MKSSSCIFLLITLILFASCPINSQAQEDPPISPIIPIIPSNWFIINMYNTGVLNALSAQARSNLINVQASPDSTDAQVNAATRVVQLLIGSTLSEVVSFISNTPGTTVTPTDTIARQSITNLVLDYIATEP